LGFPDFDEFIRKMLMGIAKQFKLMALLEDRVINRDKPNFEEDLPIVAEVFSLGGKKILTVDELKKMNDSFYSSPNVPFIPPSIWKKAKKNYEKLKNMEEELDYEKSIIAHLAMIYQTLFLTISSGSRDSSYINMVIKEFSKFLDRLREGKFKFYSGVDML